MTTGFQPNAFQTDAFQVDGGNTGTTTYSITALPGSYSLTGSDVTISRNRALTASAGAYGITGSDVTLLRHRSITCLAGEYVITGSPVTITWSGETPVEAPPVGAGGSSSRKKRPRIAIVEIDGKEYRVPVEQLQEFLNAIPQKADPQPIPKKRKQKQKAVQAVQSAPQIIVRSIPVEDIELVQRHVDRTNEIMRQVWEGAIKRYLEDIEEEEWLLMLL